MWLFSGRCNCTTRLEGKTVVITGANCARVIIACRDLNKAEEAVADIRRTVKTENGAGELAIVKLDLSSLASVRECAQHLLRTESKIHILINNAVRTLDMDDVAWEKRPYIKRTAYFESKLANVLFNTELSLQLKGKEVTTYAVHPGLVVTDSARYLPWLVRFTWEKVLCYFLKTPEQGCQTSVHCAVSEQLARQSGLYYSDCKIAGANRKIHDEDFRRKFWEKSAQLVGLGSWNPFTAKDTGELPPDTRKAS
ncbi:Retinol dehydrogenase 11 [Blattella germanica]|nr:Retinol dehydrogenase 11 [Blattella germanica]